MNRGTLQNCPTCLRAWPQSANHDVRSLVWLGDLPRRVSASNPDVLFHDGAHGPDRFLLMEIKRVGEPWQPGQEWFLRAMSRIPNFTVRVLRGTLDRLFIERVTPDAIGESRPTRPEAIRSTVVSWVEGNAWQDPRAIASFGASLGTPRLCGWCKHEHPVGTTCAAVAS